MFKIKFLTRDNNRLVESFNSVDEAALRVKELDLVTYTVYNNEDKVDCQLKLAITEQLIPESKSYKEEDLTFITTIRI